MGYPRNIIDKFRSFQRRRIFRVKSWISHRLLISKSESSRLFSSISFAYSSLSTLQLKTEWLLNILIPKQEWDLIVFLEEVHLLIELFYELGINFNDSNYSLNQSEFYFILINLTSIAGLDYSNYYIQSFSVKMRIKGLENAVSKDESRPVLYLCQCWKSN